MFLLRTEYLCSIERTLSWRRQRATVLSTHKSDTRRLEVVIYSSYVLTILF